MSRLFATLLAAACLAPLGLAAALPAAAQQAPAPAAEHYSVETTLIGKLLDDPDAAAILQRLIPTVYANDMFQTMGRPNTLRTAAQYESDVLTPAKMAEIQAALDALYARRTGRAG